MIVQPLGLKKQKDTMTFFINSQPSEFMSITASLSEFDMTASIGGTNVMVHVFVENSFKTSMSFTYFHQPYTFVVSKWSGRSQRGFFEKFHEHSKRDAANFGQVKDDGELDITMPQKLTIVAQAVTDVFVMLDRILQTHGRGIVDYAIWYCEHKPKEDTYGELIAKATCHCIVHSSFLDPKVSWTEVIFA